jgi:hypothetical protein
MKKASKFEVEGMRALGKCSIRARAITIPVKFFSGTEERESTHLSRAEEMFRRDGHKDDDIDSIEG